MSEQTNLEQLKAELLRLPHFKLSRLLISGEDGTLHYDAPTRTIRVLYKSKEEAEQGLVAAIRRFMKENNVMGVREMPQVAYREDTDEFVGRARLYVLTGVNEDGTEKVHG